MRELRFKAWNEHEKLMCDPFDFLHGGLLWRSKHETAVTYKALMPEDILLQFTGLKDKNGKEIYEGDIFRIEEDGDEACDQCDGCGWYEGGESLKTECPTCNGTGSMIGPDKIIYVTITWIQEWCMFATLRVEDEYPAYLQGGVKKLDEPMFWTYTLEDTNSRKHFLCGNIFQNPELIKS